jgi:hypothetical protein
MPALKNPKHELFCQAIVNGASQVDAAKQAKLFRPDSKNFHTMACRLAKRKEIVRRIAALALRGENRVAKDFKVTREWLVAQLVSNVLQAKEQNQVSAANKALEMLGNNAGGDCSFVQRTEVTLWDGDLSTLDDNQLRRMAEHFERLAFGQDQARLLSEKRRVLLAAGAVVDVEATPVESTPEPIVAVTTPDEMVTTPTTTEAPAEPEIEDPLEGL